MKCPRCSNPRLRYNTKLTKTKTREGKKLSVRTDYSAQCKKCGWKGDILVTENCYDINIGDEKNNENKNR